MGDRARLRTCRRSHHRPQACHVGLRHWSSVCPRVPAGCSARMAEGSEIQGEAEARGAPGAGGGGGGGGGGRGGGGCGGGGGGRGGGRRLPPAGPPADVTQLARVAGTARIARV